MTFFQQLVAATAVEREALLNAPLITRALNHHITLAEYQAFLTQAYHHVKHTVPLLMAAGSRFGEDKEWLREAMAEYIDEELGHEAWILRDIEASGGDAGLARSSKPLAATEVMVAYAYDLVQRINPIAMFGMVFVLEGTSTRVASKAARAIGHCLDLPPQAFTYLDSHGELDIGHMQFFENLMNRIEDTADQSLIVHSAGMFYTLYGNIFHAIHSEHQRAVA